MGAIELALAHQKIRQGHNVFGLTNNSNMFI